MHVATWIGSVVLIGGLGVLVGYGIYYFTWVVFGTPEVPLPIKFAISAVAIGLFILVSALVIERWGKRKNEEFKEVKY